MFVACLLPLAALLATALTRGLGANPVEALTHHTGDWALRLLLVTLAVSPLRALTGWSWLLRVRRMLGLFAFFYASLHLLIYVWLDRQLALGDIVEDVLERPYVTLGFGAYVLLLPLALTSTNAMIRRLGARRWRLLHRAVYAAAALAVAHFLWLVKADLREPLIYAGVLALLLALRLPPVARSLAQGQGQGQGQGQAQNRV